MSLTETEAFIRERIDEAAMGSRVSWIVADRVTDSPIGMVSRRRVGPQAFRIAYVIGRALWGRGYATEAAGALVTSTLQLPGIDRVEAFCDVENARSARVLDKLGMTFVGILPRSGHAPNIGRELRDSRGYIILREAHGER